MPLCFVCHGKGVRVACAWAQSLHAEQQQAQHMDVFVDQLLVKGCGDITLLEEFHEHHFMTWTCCCCEDTGWECSPCRKA